MSDFNQSQLKINAEKILTHFHKPLSKAAEIVLLIAFTIIAYTFLLYFAKYLWVVYTATPVGQTYAKIYEESYRVTNDVLSRDIIGLVINLTLTSSVICLITGTILKFLHIIRYFYSDRGFFVKIFFIGMPLTYFVATYLYYTGDYNHMDTAFTVAFVPTLFVFTGCFKFAEAFVPELVDLICIFNKHHSSVRRMEEFRSNKDELMQNEAVKKGDSEWQMKLQLIWNLYAPYIIVVLIIISVTGILFVISQTPYFNRMKAPVSVEAATDSITEQKTATLKKENRTDDRFVAYADKTVLDTKTGLMWAAEESETLNWHEAGRYCKNYRGGGYNDWRMPTVNELEGLYDSNQQPDCGCITNLIEMYNGTNCWEWSSETKDSDAAFFAFNLNGKQWLPQSNKSSVHIRPVRSFK